MTENKSTYGGRKIRIMEKGDLQEIPMTSYEEIPKDSTTWGIAASKEMLKPGMVVVFKDCVFQSIELSYEMTGLKQHVSYELTKGIVVKNKDGELAIFAVIRITSECGLTLQGRYGRANGFEAISCLAKSISKHIKKCNTHLLPRTEFMDFCEDNYFIVDYLCEIVTNFYTVVISNGKTGLRSIDAGDLEERIIRIQPGSEEYHIYNIGISIEGRDLECCLKKGKAKTINHLYSFQENPHELYVEIRGGS